MLEAENAVALDPQNCLAHFIIGLSSEKTGDMGRAEREYNATLQLVREDPNFGADRPGIVKYLGSRGMRVY
jgi:Tfp pilus assembly protein PilF